MRSTWLWLIAAGIACGGRSVASNATPPAQMARTQLALTGDSVFWRTFRSGAYDEIPRAMTVLKAAYLQNPADHVTAARIGFLHAWQLAERARLESVSPAITDHATLARRYFERAEALDPTRDPRVQGFAAVFRMTEAEVHQDHALAADGLARARRAIDRWPEFNWFTVGYVLSARPDTSALFREALEMQWKTLEACGGAVDRDNPTPSTLVVTARQTDVRHQRACGNTWIAPHNVEGFFLNMGDMLVKSGEWRRGRKIYALAAVAPSYSSWHYREVLEARIRDAEHNVAAFRRRATRGAPYGGQTIMLTSPFACMACHEAATR